MQWDRVRVGTRERLRAWVQDEEAARAAWLGAQCSRLGTTRCGLGAGTALCPAAAHSGAVRTPHASLHILSVCFLTGSWEATAPRATSSWADPCFGTTLAHRRGDSQP